MNLPSNLVAYQAPTTTPTTAPATTTDDRAADHDDDGPAAPSTTTTTRRPATATADHDDDGTACAAAAANSEGGEATWYGAAPTGMCASPTLPFGTVLTVVNNATGASTVCTVDDREAAGYPRVVDLSPAGFSQIAGLGQGVVDVTISW